MRRASLPIFRRSSGTTDRAERSISTDSPCVTQRRSSVDSPVPARIYSRLLELPLELQGEVLGYCGRRDIFSLRLTSRCILRLVQANEHVIVRNLFWRLEQSTSDLPCLCPSKPPLLRPCAAKIEPTFDNYFQHLHDARTVNKLVNTLMDIIANKVLGFSIRTANNAQHVRTFRNMYSRLQLAMIHLHYYQTEYRRELEHDAGSPSELQGTENARQRRIIGQMCIPCLVECHGIRELLFHIMCLKSRQKTYAGALERFARRWNGEAAPLSCVMMLFVDGGFDLVEYWINLKPYSVRCSALAEYIEQGKMESLAVQKHRRRRFPRTSSGRWSKTDPWLELLRNQYSTIVAKSLPVDEEFRRNMFEYFVNTDAPIIFEAWEHRVLETAPTLTRDYLPRSWDYVFSAMKAAPKELDYSRMENDWTAFHSHIYLSDDEPG